ncbi:MAG: tetratricopeptide repeat protein [Archangium sp.]|nr:tetratricopeptide repeat protein [Archangium sp.]
MPGQCPSDETLEAFARGQGEQSSRAELGAHVRGCAKCQARYLPIALETSALTQTNFDSPAARRRKAEAGNPTPVTPVMGDPTTDPHGLENTHVSGETHADVVLSEASGVTKGEALDRYVILERLGAGGMGEVFSAWDPVLDRKVAVKVLRGDFEGSPLGEELKTRLLREAQSLARLSHPNVVTVHDVGLANGRIFLAMEFVEGLTLKKWLEGGPEKKRPGWRSILEVFLAAGEGLAAAHEQGITHRDFKPDNVVVSTDGRVRVMDFGLAHGEAAPPTERATDEKRVRRTITAPGAMLGTPAYMSLEALHSQPTDFRSDEFSFCVALFEALYGVRPFEGATPGALAVEIEGNRVVSPPRSEVPKRIHQLILKGLRANPAERFQTLRALLIQLGRRRSNRDQGVTAASISVLAVLAVGLTITVWYRGRTRCSDVEGRLAGVWDSKVRESARAAFVASDKPWAAAAWKEAETRLDAYAAQWLTQRRAACESAMERDDAQLGQEILCLSRRLSDLEATTQLLSRADAEVIERAVPTVSALPSLSACRSAQGLKTQTDSLRTDLSAVKARLDAGKFADALALASEVAVRADAENDRAAFAEARLWAAIARMRQGDGKAAETLIEESILAAVAARDDELQARGWVERVGFAALSGSSADADRWAKFARAALDRIGAPLDLEASLANNLGVLAAGRGDFARALESHQRALTLRRQVLGEKHWLVARSHSNLGVAFKGLGRFDDARAQYEQALAIDEAALDPSHPQVAETLNNLGNVLQAQGQPTAARRALERALRIKEGAFGADSLPVAVTLTNLGALLLDLSDLEAATAALQRALAIKEQKAPDSTSLAITLTNLAQARRAQKQWKESIAFDDRALKIRVAKLGEQHLDVAYNLTGLGEAKFKAGDLPGARADLERALLLRRDRGQARAATAYWLARALEGTRDTRISSLFEEAATDLPAASPLGVEARAAFSRLRK